jgi:hypothetical protein
MSGLFHLQIYSSTGYWEEVETLGGRTSLEEVGHWDLSLKGVFCPQPLPPSAYTSWLPPGEQLHPTTGSLP